MAGWSSFNALVHPHIPIQTKIGYCPIIDASSTEFRTIYTVMKNIQAMTASLGQEECAATFDLAMYMKVQEVKWRCSDEFKNMVVRIGGFHIALNFLAVIGKKYEMSGLEDLIIESGIYGSSTTTMILKGKSYNRGVRAHKILMEAMLRLKWNAFSQWLAKQNDNNVNKRAFIQQVMACQICLGDDESFSSSIKLLSNQIEKLEPDYKRFEKESRSRSQLFAYWDDFISIDNIFFEFVKAERTGNWPKHLSVTAGMTPHFNSMGRPNYSKYLPVYQVEMNLLPETHPTVHSEYMSGNHAISRSETPFSQVWTDMALEQVRNINS